MECEGGFFIVFVLYLYLPVSTVGVNSETTLSCPNESIRSSIPGMGHKSCSGTSLHLL